MADGPTIDKIVAWCERKGLPPLAFIAIHLHETMGGDLATTVNMPDGTQFQTFRMGDYGKRPDGTEGYQSFGPFHIYAKVHGPFRENGMPDWDAAIRKWHDVDTTMDYLWENRWCNFWIIYKGDEGFAADPISWLDRHARDMQGSLDWTRNHAISAYDAAQDAYDDYLERKNAPTPEPEDTRITVDELLAGYRLVQQGLAATIEGIEAVLGRAANGVRM